MPLPARMSRRMLAACGASFCLAAAPLHADVLFRFGFNEGAGSTVTNDSATLTGVLGPNPDTTGGPVTNDSSPSGGASDKSVTSDLPYSFLLMDATNNVALHDLTQPITAEAWINITDGTTFRPMGITGYGFSWKLGILNSGNLAMTLFGVADVDSGVFVPQGSWQHVAAVWTPGVGITFYLNGAEASTVAETRAMRAPQNSYLGVGSSGFNGETITGVVDRIRVHRAALTAEQLDSDPATAKAPLGSTVASFNFSEAAAPYANNGTLAIPALPAFPIIAANQSPKFTTDTASGKPGDTALVFDGNDRLAVDDSAQQIWSLTGDFTAQAWVKFPTLPTSRQIIMAKNGPGGAFSFSITSGGVLFVTTYGIADTTSTTAKVPDDGLWHHVAVVHRSGTDLRFYVDGVLGSTVPYTGGLLFDRTATTFYIGGETTGFGLPFRGSLDRVQLDNVALDAKDLDYLAVPGVTPDAPELEVATAISVAWPTAATGFILQSTTNLNNAASWTNVATAPIVIGDKFYTLLPALQTESFFRLVRPDEN